MKILTYKNLKTSFIDFGVKPGMKLIVHSTLKSFGIVEGGAQLVSETLEDINNNLFPLNN